MTDLLQVLAFACHTCRQPVRVTVRCQGDGLLAKPVAAAIGVPCPTCGQVNHLVFEPATGKVRGVARPTPTGVPGPSQN